MIEDNGYPFATDRCPRTIIFAESGTVAEIREKLEQLAGVAKIKRGLTRREQTPPVQNDHERGEGDSINSRLHRLIGGRQ
jgi:hypothetical protein